MAQGPLDDLVEAIQNLIEDLAQKTETAHKNFDQTTTDHNSEVARLNSEINTANTDISNGTDMLNNVLYPAKRQLEESITQLHANIDGRNNLMEQLTNDRNADHEAFQVRVQEHNDAVSAIDEALELLRTLSSGNVSFAQVSRVKSSLQKITNKLPGRFESRLAKSLLSVASSEFADTEAISNVMTLLSDVRENLVASLNQENADEERAVKEYNAEMERNKNENQADANQITIKTGELNATDDAIAEKEAFVAARRSDLANFQQELQEENENYEAATNAYNELVA